MKNKLTVGILAHVDAGKTTLAESILYLSGKIRKLGRVDHKDAYLDHYELERARGITIFSKQAEVEWKETFLTLLDTPGHVDFSAEMERSLSVLDYAVLVISGADGVQGHVQTLWRLLKHYEVPTFLFINKMDQDGTDRTALLEELKSRLDTCCVDFSSEFVEELAMCDETILERYLDGEEPSRADIQNLIVKRKVFPCYFGSALKLEGVEELLDGIHTYGKAKDYPSEFGAKIYKISRDYQGARLTHMKITGGNLKVKSLLKPEEKVDQIRIYSGTGYEMVQEVSAGSICVVTGLNTTYSGEGLGFEKESEKPMLEPVLNYKLIFPQGSDLHGIFARLRLLEEEIPELQIAWNEHTGEIHAKVMGEVQIEILKNLIYEKLQTEVEFDTGSIVYRETIAEAAEGAGHYEPLRHYAEVRLLLEPTERGLGLVFETDCSEDVLDKNWQRLILTHLQEKKHVGVLTGSEITDIKITLVNGRAHLKHTEGGDFRQATYRAVRQGLKRAESILLEPVYEYQLEVPADLIGRAMTDVQRMSGTFDPPEIVGDFAVLKGTAPVATMQHYQTEVVSYTKGLGRLFVTLKGYEPCHNAEEVIATIGYDAEADMENPTGSVFCAHGAGFVVSWDEVESHMHTTSYEKMKKRTSTQSEPTVSYADYPVIDEEELRAIFERTYGTIKRERNPYNHTKVVSADSGRSRAPKKPVKTQEYLLVDGYNIIFAWDELKELAEVNLQGARGKLMDILCNYQGYRQNTVILVFDGYKVTGNIGEMQKYHNIYVVYTKEAETADQYIEKAVHEIAKEHEVKVATSDAMEQMIIIGQGAFRMSAKDLLTEIMLTNQQMKEEHMPESKSLKQHLIGSRNLEPSD